MNSTRVLELLIQSKPILAARYGLKRRQCMSDSTQREWRFYIDDIIGFAEKFIVYTQDLDQDGLVRSGLT